METWGIVNRVLPDDQLDEKALAFAATLASGPTRAYDVTKQMLLTFRNEGATAAGEMTPGGCATLFETEDLAHGIESLLANGPGHAALKGR
jgi:enoyl-CoA hydratase